MFREMSKGENVSLLIILGVRIYVLDPCFAAIYSDYPFDLPTLVFFCIIFLALDEK